MRNFVLSDEELREIVNEFTKTFLSEERLIAMLNQTLTGERQFAEAVRATQDEARAWFISHAFDASFEHQVSERYGCVPRILYHYGDAEVLGGIAKGATTANRCAEEGVVIGEVRIRPREGWEYLDRTEPKTDAEVAETHLHIQVAGTAVNRDYGLSAEVVADSKVVAALRGVYELAVSLGETVPSLAGTDRQYVVGHACVDADGTVSIHIGGIEIDVDDCVGNNIRLALQG